MPVHEISLRLLTFKLIALIALTTASRNKALLALDLRCMSVFADKVIFKIQQLLRPVNLGLLYKELFYIKFLITDSVLYPRYMNF